MSAPNTSSSSSQLISYAQDVDYTQTEGFKRFKASFNVKNTRVARNNPCGAYLTAKAVFQVVKGPGCSQQTFNRLSLDNFISAGLVTARHCLKCLSLAPYYVAQMKHCPQKWDRHNEQGPLLTTIDTCHQLMGIVGTSLYHLMADVQLTVGQTVDPVLSASTDLT